MLMSRMSCVFTVLFFSDFLQKNENQSHSAGNTSPTMEVPGGLSRSFSGDMMPIVEVSTRFVSSSEFFFNGAHRMGWAGIIKLPSFGGIKQCKSMVILRDFAYNRAFV